jgi:hypothetical protein
MMSNLRVEMNGRYGTQTLIRFSNGEPKFAFRLSAKSFPFRLPLKRFYRGR